MHRQHPPPTHTQTHAQNSRTHRSPSTHLLEQVELPLELGLGAASAMVQQLHDARHVPLGVVQQALGGGAVAACRGVKRRAAGLETLRCMDKTCSAPKGGALSLAPLDRQGTRAGAEPVAPSDQSKGHCQAPHIRLDNGPDRQRLPISNTQVNHTRGGRSGGTRAAGPRTHPGTHSPARPASW